MQLALFGGEDAVGFDPDFGGLHRTTLAAGAWVDYVPGWLRGQQALFVRLERSVQWQATTQFLFEREVATPRGVASFPKDGSPPEEMIEIAAALTARYRVGMDRLSAAFYRDGQDSVAWHRDREIREHARSVVAIVSLGGPRRFLVRPRSEFMPNGRRSATTFKVGFGDLLVMGGTAQRTHEHAVPKCAHAEPRIALMFRHDPAALRQRETP